MKKRKQVQVIKKNGNPEWAVIPYKEYIRLQELESLAEDVKAFKRALSRKEEELIPHEYAERLIAGENAIRVWRELRQLTQAALAQQIGVSTPYFSQLENDERTASLNVLKKIAKTLKVALDDLT